LCLTAGRREHKKKYQRSVPSYQLTKNNTDGLVGESSPVGGVKNKGNQTNQEESNYTRYQLGGNERLAGESQGHKPDQRKRRWVGKEWFFGWGGVGLWGCAEVCVAGYQSRGVEGNGASQAEVPAGGGGKAQKEKERKRGGYGGYGHKEETIRGGEQ